MLKTAGRTRASPAVHTLDEGPLIEEASCGTQRIPRTSRPSVIASSTSAPPKSIRIQLEIRQTTDTGEGKAFEFPIKQEWAATSSGQRYFDDWFMPPSDMAFDHRSVYSDGHKFAHVWFLQQDPTRQYEISYNRDELLERRDFFVDAPQPIKFTHVGLIPLHEALPTAEIMPAAEVIGRGCDVFHFSKAGKPSDPASLVYYLDAETAYPLKVVIYHNLDRFRAELRTRSGKPKRSTRSPVGTSSRCHRPTLTIGRSISVTGNRNQS